MADCAELCPREKVSRGPPSPGPVNDIEYVCRAAYSPLHFKNGVLRNKVIRRSDLVRDELSVWRLLELSAGKLSQLAAKLPVPRDNVLEQILAVQVRVIRALQGPNATGRAFSVIDDTVINDAGDRDGQHAVLAPCQSWRIDRENPDPVIVDGLINRLYLEFRKAKVWPFVDQAPPAISNA